MTLPEFVHTPVEDIPKIQQELRRAFASGKTKSIAYRKEQLAQLAYLIKDNADRFKESLASDLGRPPLESDLLELGAAISEAREAYDNVDKWARTERAPMTFNFFAMRPSIRKEPKGVVMIISPFNFPIFLTLGPLAGALAAGNAAVLKPSELSPATSALFAELVPQYLDPELVRVVNGSVEETTKLLELPWDHILYTGSSRIAKIVLAAAAKHLTPVSTELGGKSPVVIDPKTDLKLAARRIMWGKMSNAGQVCVAPDYVLIPRTSQDAFVKELEEVYTSFYPEGPSSSSSFSRIVSQQHAARVKRLIDGTKGKIVFGGEADVEKRYVAPTVVRDVGEDDTLMSEEIFGPVLPIVPVDDLDEAIAKINSRDHPLVLYVFTQDSKFKAKVFDNTQSGAAIANEVLIHVGTPGLPFGGIGQSGSGQHTGKYSFDMFTHLRSTLDNPAWLDLILGSRYPPYTPKKQKALSALLGTGLPPRPGQKRGLAQKRWGFWLAFALVGSVSAVLMKRRDLLAVLSK